MKLFSHWLFWLKNWVFQQKLLHQILHIRINVDAKFHLKQTILIVLAKFTQKSVEKNRVYRQYCIPKYFGYHET